MKLPHKAHVAIVDGENFTVMQNHGQPFEPRLEGARKPDLSGSNFSAVKPSSSRAAAVSAASSGAIQNASGSWWGRG